MEEIKSWPPALTADAEFFFAQLALTKEEINSEFLLSLIRKNQQMSDDNRFSYGIRDKNNHSLLFYAIKNGHEEIAQILAKAFFMELFAQLTLKKDQINIEYAKFLLKEMSKVPEKYGSLYSVYNGKQNTFLHWSVYNGHDEVTGILLKKIQKLNKEIKDRIINAANKNNDSPLHMAIYQGNSDRASVD